MAKIKNKLAKKHKNPLKAKKQRLINRINQCKTLTEIKGFEKTFEWHSTLSKDEYTTDIRNLKTGGGKQRHNFFGLILADNKISRAYACILKNNKVYCIEGSTDGSYHTSNIGILNQIFTKKQCY